LNWWAGSSLILVDVFSVVFAVITARSVSLFEITPDRDYRWNWQIALPVVNVYKFVLGERFDGKQKPGLTIKYRSRTTEEK